MLNAEVPGKASYLWYGFCALKDLTPVPRFTRPSSRLQDLESGCLKRLQASFSGLLSQVLLSASPLHAVCHTVRRALCTTMTVLVQVRHICRRPLHTAWTCRAIVAPTTRTNGAALGTGKPVLDNPLWRDSLQADNTAAQLFRQPKSILPNRLRLFAGTANPVCEPLQRPRVPHEKCLACML